MNIPSVVSLTKDLISIPSLSGDEAAVMLRMEEILTTLQVPCERMEICPGRFNLLAGNVASIIFTTHLDVVPFQPHQIQPKIRDGLLFGRGACDAKGLAACMTVAILELIQSGETQVGLLLVVGEEDDGIGAKTAAERLKNRGVVAIVNGEPTEEKLAVAHKGGLGFSVCIPGLPAHSGYPERGVDANKRLIELASLLYETNFGKHPRYGTATCNIGILQGGRATNIISPEASMQVLIRTVSESEQVRRQVRALIPEEYGLEFNYEISPTEMTPLDGFEHDVVSYASDVPFFSKLNVPIVMYGPGSIFQAHTDDEYIQCDALERGVLGYKRIFRELRKRCS